MTAEQAKERRALVWRVRRQRAEALKSHYLEVEARVIPCCASCKFNESDKCKLSPAPGIETGHRYGHNITDPEDLCLLWAASVPAFLRAFRFAYGISEEQAEQQAQKTQKQPVRWKTPRKEVSQTVLDAQIALYKAGKTGMKEAASAIGLSVSSFYRRLKESKLCEHQEEEDRKKRLKKNDLTNK